LEEKRKRIRKLIRDDLLIESMIRVMLIFLVLTALMKLMMMKKKKNKKMRKQMCRN